MRDFIYSYFKVYNQRKCVTRFFVSDDCWAEIYGALEAFNNESIDKYSGRVWRLASEVTTYNLGENIIKTWLCQCIAHTMNIFTYSVKKDCEFLSDDDIYYFSIHCFSLLVNSLTLKEQSDIYYNICLLFLSKYINAETETENAYDCLDNIISNRPDKEKIKKIIHFYLHGNGKDDVIDEQVEEENEVYTIKKNNVSSHDYLRVRVPGIVIKDYYELDHQGHSK